MHNILKTLNVSQRVLDLGCGGGSFNYATYPCHTIGIDISLKPSRLFRDGDRVQYLEAKAEEIPLASHTVDVVICHHSLEHFPQYSSTLKEICRVLTANGLLWIAVPNGYSFDDAFYRSVDAAHGHVNRFRLHDFINTVQGQTDLKLIQSISLFSGFVYLKRRPLKEFKYCSLLGMLLNLVPPPFHQALILSVNAGTRLLDKTVGSRLSQYGWAFIFARKPIALESLPSYFNVCWNCGSGHGAVYLKSIGRITSRFGLRLFSCPQCQRSSIFFDPPETLQ